MVFPGLSAAPLLMATSAAPDPEFRSAASNFTAAQTTSLVIDKPFGVVAGDLLVAMIFASYVPSEIHLASSSGWTLEETRSDNYRAVLVLRKVAGGTEPSNYTFTLPSGLYLGGIYAIQKATVVDVVGSFTYSSGTDTATAVGITFPKRSMLIGVFGNGSQTATGFSPPPGMTNRTQILGQTPGSLSLCDMVENAGSTGDRSGTWTTLFGKAPHQLLLSVS